MGLLILFHDASALVFMCDLSVVCAMIVESTDMAIKGDEYIPTYSVPLDTNWGAKCKWIVIGLIQRERKTAKEASFTLFHPTKQASERHINT